MIKVSKIKTNPNNPRVIKDDKFKKLVKSIKDFPEMMAKRPIVCVTDSDGSIYPLGGNMRLKAIKELQYKEIADDWVLMADEWTEAQRKEFVIKDNVGFGEWDWEELSNEWNSEKLGDWGIDMPIYEEDESLAVQKLDEKFIVPPFSVINTREGYWQERKRYWNVLIGDRGESRDDIVSKVNHDYSSWENKPYKGGVIRDKSISILDAVLAEIVNKWYGLDNCNTFDCFAGDTVFGYVSSYMGNSFTGIELRKEQVEINNERLNGFNSRYICDDGRNILNHIDKDSQDLLFSCPPYFNLEVYSDLPNDASNQKNYDNFLEILNVAFTNALQCLKENRFAVITVGDIRDANGFYYGFIDDIKNIFKKNNVLLYNELILVQSVGNGALRANGYMKSRKVVKMHESILVFYKGDPKKIKDIYPKIEIDNYESKDV